MKRVRFIGDIHGKYIPYLKLLEDSVHSVQVGDFGMGFGVSGRAELIDRTLNDVSKETMGAHRFIRGNHDSPEECAKSSQWIKDGTVEDDVMYMGGARSIDWMWRKEGVSWWRNEEMTVTELDEMVAIYDQHRPKILVTHECSESFAQRRMIPLVGGITDFASTTRDALDAMYAIEPPMVHIFGHWHKSVDEIDRATGTRMICLAELDYLDMDI